jgi:enterochelin esterase-like enzyme
VFGLLRWSLISGPFPFVVAVLGAGSLAELLAARRRGWRQAPAALAIATALTVGVSVLVSDVWRPFPDPLPRAVLGWLAVALTALTLTGYRVRTARWRQRLLAIAMALTVVVWSAVEVNRIYGQYPTAYAAFGLAPSGQIQLRPVGFQSQPALARQVDQRLDEVWRPPAGMPAHGGVSEVAIPSSAGHFHPRKGWVYLPPAYLTARRPLLPVLVLLAGQPGSPRDWLDGGRLAPMFDAFAAAHQGLAPVVVIPDDLGKALANPLCLDSRLGNVETYLAVDVPTWVKQHLQIDTDTRRWAIGGYSHGGTCALQLAVRAPRVYPTFIDISGQDEPTLGDRQRTVGMAFRGDLAAFRRVNPLDILAAHQFPDTAAMIVAGDRDSTYRPQQRRVHAACQAAGMQVAWLDLPGGHSWSVWGPGLQRSLPWLATRTGMTQ